jgi:hypothetical protein
MTGHHFVTSDKMKTWRLCTIRWVFGWSIARSRPKIWASLRMLILTFMDTAIHCLEMRVLPIVGRPIWSRDTACATVRRIGAVDRLLTTGWCVMMCGIGVLVGQILWWGPMFMTFVW